jgi:hypothetical protein
MLQARTDLALVLFLPDFNLTGLSRGGQQIQKSRETYVKAVGTLVELASLQVSSGFPDEWIETETNSASTLIDCIYNLGRSHQGDQPTGERHRTRRHPSIGKHCGLYQFRIG